MQPEPKPPSKEWILAEAIRQALIIALGAVEDWMGIPRSVLSRAERRAARRGEQSPDDGRYWGPG